MAGNIGIFTLYKPDTELEKRADEIIDIIAKAQQPDGYLNTYFTIKEPEKDGKTCMKVMNYIAPDI